ncbi:MAG TPA: nucleotidyltransferase domain-containing protein [Kofleriaceae bacterium]|nr:nucleotidyltransferase domain-containing protein [Kofleriaceae bacterium]
MTLPAPIDQLVDELAAMPGAVAVTLGGSRASGSHDAHSDWDLGVYYRGPIALDSLARRGTVHPPGSWGRLMNGGAWLDVGGIEVDVMLRDLDVVEGWCARAAVGEYEVDALLGYVAGAPTYLLLAERASGRTLRGSLPAIGAFPDALASAATERWRFHARFSLEQARMRVARDDAAGLVAQATKAAIETAHARLCAQRTWVLNEKRILDRAGLAAVHAHVAGGLGGAPGAWLDALEALLDHGSASGPGTSSGPIGSPRL